MSDMQVYQPFVPERRVSRALGSLVAQTELRVAAIEGQGEVEEATVSAIGYVGRRGLQEVALVSQMEQQLAQLVPIASGRLQAIADITALSMAEAVANAAHHIGRR